MTGEYQWSTFAGEFGEIRIPIPPMDLWARRELEIAITGGPFAEQGREGTEPLSTTKKVIVDPEISRNISLTSSHCHTANVPPRADTVFRVAQRERPNLSSTCSILRR